MGQLGLAEDTVADGVHARDIGAVELVDEHFVALHGDTQLFEADPLNVGLDPHGREHDVRRQGFGALFALDLDLATPFGVDPDRFHGRRGHHRRPQFAECALHRLRYLLVLERHHAGHVLHHGDLHAQRGVEPRELAADGARTHDDHCFGQPGERQRLARRDHVLAVDGHERHFARARPRGEDDMVGFVVRAADVEPACRRQAPEALYEVYVVFLQQEGHALGHGFGHAARARHDFFQIGMHLARE